MTSAAAITIAQVAAPTLVQAPAPAAAVASVEPKPVQLAAATVPAVPGFSAFARAASISTFAAAPAPAPAPAATAPAAVVAKVAAAAPAPVTLLAPPKPVLAAAAPAAASGFSAFFPKIFPASAKAVEAVVSLPGKLGGVISQYLSSATRDEEHECLATAVYYESKGEPLEGQLAVAKVVLNRVKSGQYASSVCGVVKQKAQFSFVHRGRLPSAPKASAAWQRAVAVAAVARDNLADSVAGTAMSFHATYVAPAWRRGMSRVARIGAHIFYR